MFFEYFILALYVGGKIPTMEQKLCLPDPDGDIAKALLVWLKGTFESLLLQTAQMKKAILLWVGPLECFSKENVMPYSVCSNRFQKGPLFPTDTSQHSWARSLHSYHFSQSSCIHYSKWTHVNAILNRNAILVDPCSTQDNQISLLVEDQDVPSIIKSSLAPGPSTLWRTLKFTHPQFLMKKNQVQPLKDMAPAPLISAKNQQNWNAKMISGMKSALAHNNVTKLSAYRWQGFCLAKS